MANLDQPFGFMPKRHLTGGIIRAAEYKMVNAEASAIFSGDPVILAATGYLDVAAATNANQIGVFHGVRWIDLDGSVRFSQYWPAGQTGIGEPLAYVYDDPSIVYEVQCQGGALAQTNIGNNVDLQYNAGDTLIGRSRAAIDMSAPGAASAQYRILGLSARPGNALGAFAIADVIFNEHLHRVTAGI